jgi:hypothetical protein
VAWLMDRTLVLSFVKLAKCSSGQDRFEEVL